MSASIASIDKSEKFTWLVRLGFVARGLSYLALGYLALKTRAEAGAGNQAVFDLMQDVPFGSELLYLMALGLLAYALFKLLSAFSDIQNRGTGKEALAKRVGDAASGAVYLFLAYAASNFARGITSHAAAGQTQEKVATVLDWGIGPIVIGVVGLGLLTAAVVQAKEAYTAGFMKDVRGGAPGWVETIGRIGHGTRAVVFLIMGWSLVKAAWADSSQEVKGLGEAIMSLRESGVVYTVVCVGLMLFGLFSVLVAQYRIIPDVKRDDLKPKLG